MRKLILFLFISFSITIGNAQKFNLIEHELLCDSIKKYIVSTNIKFPEVVYKQAVLESGNFKSGLFKTNNNMFGMKHSYRRPSSASKPKGYNKYSSYAYYEHWKYSILDYALYQTYILRNKKINSAEEYAKYISNSYAEAKDYYKYILP